MDAYKIKGRRSSLPVPFRYALSVAIFFSAAIIFLIIGAFVTNILKDPISWVRILAYAFFFGSVLVSGAIASRLTDKGPVGSVVASLFFGAFLLLGSLFFSRGEDITSRLIIFAVIPAVAVAGAFIFKRKTKKNKFRSAYKRLR